MSKRPTKKKASLVVDYCAVRPCKYIDREQQEDVTRLVAYFIKHAAKNNISHFTRATLEHAVDAYCYLTDACTNKEGGDHYDKSFADWLLDGEE